MSLTSLTVSLVKTSFSFIETNSLITSSGEHRSRCEVLYALELQMFKTLL
jgi:hypothetical protein